MRKVTSQKQTRIIIKCMTDKNDCTSALPWPTAVSLSHGPITTNQHPKWLEEKGHLLQPPIGNHTIYDGKDFIVMLVRGPNERNDYHVNETEVRIFSDRTIGTQGRSHHLRAARNGSTNGKEICFSKLSMAPSSGISRSKTRALSCTIVCLPPAVSLPLMRR